jgi:fumarate hydratase subunit beta
MTAILTLKTPLTVGDVKKLKAGDFCTLSGDIYTARDRAHKMLMELITEKKKLPFNLQGAVIYYVGPTPPRPGYVIGSAGPTTSSRMDRFAPLLYRFGVKATIGKGERDTSVKDAIRKYKGIYFITWGGCGAYLNKFILSLELIAFPELGSEAIYKLKVKDFPVIVGIDSRGRSIFKFS